MTVARAYRRAWPYYRQDWGKLLLSLLMVVLSTLANLAQPFPVAILVDSFVPSKKLPSWHDRIFAQLGPRNRIAQIAALAAVMLSLRLFSELIGLVQGYFKIRIGYNGLVRVRSDLFRKLQQLSLSFHLSLIHI